MSTLLPGKSPFVNTKTPDRARGPFSIGFLDVFRQLPVEIILGYHLVAEAFDVLVHCVELNVHAFFKAIDLGIERDYLFLYDRTDGLQVVRAERHMFHTLRVYAT